MREILRITTQGEEQTTQLAEGLAKKLLPGAVVLLNGDMGAGKSVFARSVIKTLGYGGAVTSPTFVLMNEYETLPRVFHFDMYRLESPEQLYDIGYDEYVYGKGISLIEWSEKMEYLLPEEFVEIKIEKLSVTDRMITVSVNNDRMMSE